MTAERERALGGFPEKKEERRMKLTNHEWLRAGRLLGVLLTVVCLLVMSLDNRVKAQAISTTSADSITFL